MHLLTSVLTLYFSLIFEKKLLTSVLTLYFMLIFEKKPLKSNFLGKTASSGNTAHEGHFPRLLIEMKEEAASVF